MHMPDGVLSPQVWATAGVVSVASVGAVAHRVRRTLEPKDLPVLGVLGAFIFAGQMVNFPVAFGVSGHFFGAAAAAVLLGPGPAVLVIAVVLLIQALMFQDGGVLALGANALNMAVIGPPVAWLAYRALTRSASSILARSSAAFVAAWISVMAAAAMASCELLLSGFSFWAIVPPTLGWHALIGIGEGLVTVAMLQLVWRARPGWQPGPEEAAA
jgi:cobalt/nickel transport system permease protein